MECNIGLVEDDVEFRAALVNQISSRAGLSVAFAVGSAEEALEAVAREPVDLVVVDLGLPGMSGIEFLRRLWSVCPRAEAMVLTVLADDESLFEALRAGAVGYLTKDLPPEAMVAAIYELRAGGAPMSPGIARRVVQAFSERAEEGAGLSAREREILVMLSQGYTYLNAAARLGLSIHTVHTHVRNIYRKLHVNSRAEAVYEAIRRRLVKVDRSPPTGE